MEQIIGGALIGLSVTLMLLFNGKVTGISGILGGIIRRETSDKQWRLMFLSGLLIGGVLLKVFYPMAFQFISQAGTGDYIGAGLLVGFGTALGNGCTSGHGVCGISRFSKRSILATMVFIASGAVSVLLFKIFRGEL